MQAAEKQRRRKIQQQRQQEQASLKEVETIEGELKCS